LIRRLNFTRRRRLARGDVTVRLSTTADGRARLGASFALEKYGLPLSARVFVEAYRQTSWQRFDYGTVAAPVAAGSTVLQDFGTAQGVRFRVRVVDAAVNGGAPRVLALVDDLRPLAPPEGKGGLSLLPIEWGEFEGHTWRLEVDEETGPLLRISRKLVPDREAFVGSREFVSLVLPVVLQRVLERALGEAADPEDSEDEGWAGDWLRLAQALPGVGSPPERAQGSLPSDDEEDWIDEAVEAFAKKHAIAERFAAWWSVAPS
jgi:hypothetical protein